MGIDTDIDINIDIDIDIIIDTDKDISMVDKVKSGLGAIALDGLLSTFCLQRDPKEE